MHGRDPVTARVLMVGPHRFATVPLRAFGATAEQNGVTDLIKSKTATVDLR
jgi:hypothetical protein